MKALSLLMLVLSFSAFAETKECIAYGVHGTATVEVSQEYYDMCEERHGKVNACECADRAQNSYHPRPDLCIEHTSTMPGLTDCLDINSSL